MPMQCNSCGGKYNTALPDGLLYFHACAPLPPTPGNPFVVVEHPNKRDENVVIDPHNMVLPDGSVLPLQQARGRGGVLTQATSIVSAGLGATAV